MHSGEICRGDCFTSSTLGSCEVTQGDRHKCYVIVMKVSQFHLAAMQFFFAGSSFLIYLGIWWAFRGSFLYFGGRKRVWLVVGLLLLGFVCYFWGVFYTVFYLRFVNAPM